MATTTKSARRERLHRKVRAKVFGTAERPRLCVYKSLRFMNAQIIDDERGATLASAKGADAAAIGAAIAKAALARKIKKVVFDRGGYIYTGKVRDLAEAARKAGLEF